MRTEYCVDLNRALGLMILGILGADPPKRLGDTLPCPPPFEVIDPPSLDLDSVQTRVLRAIASCLYEDRKRTVEILLSLALDLEDAR
jgi:hypothetical protein